jgi:anti-sigma factor RsiW
MNCRRIQKLIPLLAGGDLAENRAKSVRIHLEACAGCARLAEEMSASREWLQVNSSPTLEEEVFIEIRSDVLKTIAQRGWLRRRLFFADWRVVRIAAVASLLLAATGIGLYAHFHTPVGDAQSGEQRATLDPRAPVDHETPLVTAGLPDAPRKVNGNKPRRSGSQVAMTGHAQKIEPERVADERYAPGETVVDVAEETSGGGPSDLASPPTGLTRIEIQTQDPNIRIIWFSPKTSDTASEKTRTDTD